MTFEERRLRVAIASREQMNVRGDAKISLLVVSTNLTGGIECHLDIRLSPSPHQTPWKVIAARPRRLDHISLIGRLDSSSRRNERIGKEASVTVYPVEKNQRVFYME